ncbi:MAG: hypothetical protein JXB34_09380 [Bacteroidales bacterium]|nr:hypothetical protein [Bacteroidales bacterium]
MNSYVVKTNKALIIVLFNLACWLFIATSCGKDDVPPPVKPGNGEIEVFAPVAVLKTNPTKVYAHYMPWFESKESNNGTWGMHWTMSNCNPDIIDENGNHNIASHYQPLIGPYASGDKNVIEYHLLLMKYSGIDGVIIDWYGSFEVNDFAANRRNSEALIDLLDETGLQFSITYEDWTTNTVVSAGKAADKLDAAKSDMEYLQDNYFSKPEYVQVNSKPFLTIFGPQQITSPDEWSYVFSEINPKPSFLTLWYESGEAGANASGEYSWVYENNSHIDNFYSNRYNSLSVAMGSAYPGFRHYYNEGGWPSSIDWEIDHADGETYRQTLQKARNKEVEYLQLVTWNDFGEGTMIEPTKEFQYMFLEETQTFTGVSYSKSNLETVFRLYQLRKSFAGNSSVQKKLDQVFYYLVSLQADKASALIDEVENGGRD